MVRLTRRSFTTGALAAAAAAGCGGKTLDEGNTGAGAPSPTTDPRGPGFRPSAPTRPADPGIAFQPVKSPAAPSSVVWSWTTPEQAEEVRSGKILFTRESSPTLGRGFLYDVLEERAAHGDATAARLAGMELAKGRYAWSNPWATVLGAAPGETYGQELLMIEMRADTWYARVRTLAEEIDFVDANGAVVGTKRALASFERVGGILFEHDRDGGGPCSTGSGAGGLIYREIYVGSEAQLARFSHRTPTILDVLERHINELEVFSQWLKSLSPAEMRASYWPCGAFALWRSKPANTLERYLGSLAFATAPYVPTTRNVDAIVAALRTARFVPDPFVSAP